MGLFSYNKPKITEKEFKKTNSIFNIKGFTMKERDKVKQIFRGDMDEKGVQKGVDKDELAKGIDWMRKNPKSHEISGKKIDIIEEKLKKQL
ncbi:MAG: hypothetical protein A2909_01695 [Candidatus Tagabacteria bacterium RIFCSPLOWO2_01_FULL_39_11]|uniref:Uncharacterized protein n=1 Tax=Candidatus Tagabacteria bacterium RIFCSPLOWO2_01_FULL_39_11 TaxID=1802295 RepID=A0A1G2LQS2_9BACT|nr:MAG: hypothetical protein A2909_01695 [Candidatus Tagabacteria bacterium RIFCSPLOWO2_01_FULL_39_11]